MSAGRDQCQGEGHFREMHCHYCVVQLLLGSVFLCNSNSLGDSPGTVDSVSSDGHCNIKVARLCCIPGLPTHSLCGTN